MTRASEIAATAPSYRGQLPPGVAGAFLVWEELGDGSALVRNFDDEFLAMQCAVALGSSVETVEENDKDEPRGK